MVLCSGRWVGEGGCPALGGREPVSSQSAMGWRWLEAGGTSIRRRRWMVVVAGSCRSSDWR